MGWLNIFGLIIFIVMMIPNIIFAIKNKNLENKCTNKVMNFLEQVGRYGSMFFLVFNIGVWELGFRSKEGFVIWLITISILLLAYIVIWIIYFKANRSILAILLAVIPSIIFVYTGYSMGKYLLLIFGAVFTVGHIYIAYYNNMK